MIEGLVLCITTEQLLQKELTVGRCPSKLWSYAPEPVSIIVKAMEKKMKLIK